MQPYVDPGWFCGPEFRLNPSVLLNPCCANPLSCVASQCCDYPNLLNMSLACCSIATNCNGGAVCSVESGNIRSATNVASFSALGPTADGRFKPDLVAPGEDTLSAATPAQTTPGNFKSTTADHCIVPGGSVNPRSVEDNFNIAARTLSGTSMSTPLMAGGAEKIRQYFVQGYYPLGFAASGPGFIPDAALLRAVILASCKPLAGTGGIWKSPVAPILPFNPKFYRLAIPSTFSPNVIEGFGLPVLDHAVRLTDSANGYNMIYVSGSFSATQTSPAAFNVSCDPGSSIRVSLVLVWTDPAGSVSARKQLVNDLDLIVVSSDSQWFGNMRLFADQLNTVERVVLPQCPPSGNLTAVVTLGEPLKTVTQTWYLVSNGPVTQVSPTSVPPQINPGRAQPPVTQPQSCTFSPGVIVTIRFRQSSAWSCPWSCNAEIAAFTLSLSQIVGVAGQGIRVVTYDAGGVTLSLQCTAAINAWGQDAISLKFVTPTSLRDAVVEICPKPSSLCVSDAALGVFDWSSLATVEVPIAKTLISVSFFTLMDCSNISDTYGEAPNPFNFTDQTCFPGPFIMRPARMQLFYKAISCFGGYATFVVYREDATCSASSGIRTSLSTNICSSLSEGLGAAVVSCVDLTAPPSPAVPQPATTACEHRSLCLPISDSAFYAIIATLAAHILQFVAWVYLSKNRRCFSVESALILLLLPVVGLVVWRSVCRSNTSDQSDNKRLLLNVLEYVEPTLLSNSALTNTAEGSAGALGSSHSSALSATFPPKTGDGSQHMTC